MTRPTEPGKPTAELAETAGHPGEIPQQRSVGTVGRCGETLNENEASYDGKGSSETEAPHGKGASQGREASYGGEGSYDREGSYETAIGERVAVIGLGVMGGSLVRALARRGGRELRGWSPSAREREAALAAGVVGSAPASWQEAVSGADIVVLAAPLEATCELMGEVGRVMPTDATVSDVAGLKGPVASAAIEAGLARRWVGAHPMAGSEASGFGASSQRLYRGARVWMADAGAEPERREAIERLWRAAGASPKRIEIGRHDRLMVTVSHLPQLASNALAATLEELGVGAEDLGTGGREMTRLAGSDPEMWSEILAHAPGDLPDSLRLLASTLERIADHAREGGMRELTKTMRKTRAWRSREGEGCRAGEGSRV